MMKKTMIASVTLVALAVAGTAVAGGGDPYAAITSAVDFDDVKGVVAAIAGGLAIAFVFVKGAKIGLGLLRG